MMFRSATGVITDSVRRLFAGALFLALFPTLIDAADRENGIRKRLREPGSPVLRGGDPDRAPNAPWTPETNAGDYTVTVTPNPILIPTGGDGRQTFTFTLTSTGGFTDAVTVTISWSGEVIALEKNCPPATACPPPATATYTVPLNGTVSDSAIASATGPNGGTITITTTTPSLPDKTTPVVVTRNAPPPDFSLSLNPSSLTIQQSQSSTTQLNLTRTNGFTGEVIVDVTAPSGFQTSPATPITFAPGETSKPVTIIVTSSVSVAPNHTVRFTGNATSPAIGPRTTDLNVNVTQGPDFTFSANPNPLSVTQGSSAPVTLTVTPIAGFNATVNVTATTTATGVTIPSVTFAAGETSKTVNVSATSNASTGGATITFSANAPSLAKTLTSVTNLTVVPQQATGDFTISASPPELQIPTGSTNKVTLTLARQNFTGDVTIAATGATGITISPVSFTFAGASATRDFDVIVDTNAPAGRAPITFSATAVALPGVTRSASSGVTVIPVTGTAPLLTAITPSALAAGAQHAVVFLSGRNFLEGAEVLSDSADVIVESTEIQSDTIAMVVVTVDPFAQAGATQFRLRNPGGVLTPQGLDVVVYEEGDLGAPLGVTAAAILGPLGGKIVTNADRPYASGVVATSGTGTISGRWLFDGGTFDAFTLTVTNGEPVMVSSRVPIPASHAGPHQLQLVIDAPQQAQSASVALRMAIDSASNLSILSPVSGENGDGPTLRWSMVPGALGYVVEMTRDGQPFPTQIDVGQHAELTLTAADLPADTATVRWRVAPMYCCSGNDPFAGSFTEWSDLPGDRTAREDRELFESIRDSAIADAMTPRLRVQLASLSVPEQLDVDSLESSWTYQLAQAKTPTARDASLAKSGLRTDWKVLPMLTSTFTRQATDQDASLQLSGQGDLGLPPLSSKYTTDFTGANLLGDAFTFRGSRNWVVNAGNAKRSKAAVRPEVRFGYGPPDFFMGAQLVTSSLARGGALGRVATRFGSLAYYSTFTDALDGVMAGNFGMQQKLDAVALELRETKRFTFRILTMHVEDLPLSSQSAPMGKGRSLGVLTTYKVSPRLQIVAEAARGRGEWTTRNGLREREGDAFRVGLSGIRGKTSYRADLNYTDSDFANPGNRGFTASAIPNRTGGSLSITRPVGRGSATFGLRHQTQTRSAISARANGLSLSYNIALRPTVNLSATAGTNVDSADADALRRMPRSDRQQLGGTITLTERFGRFHLSQTLGHSRLDDDVNRNATNNVTTFTLSGGGKIVQNFDLFASSTIIRTDAAPFVGDGDNITISLQPAFAVPRLYLSLQPRISYNYFDNDYRETVNRGEQYSAVVQWSPEWFRKVGALQLSSNWNRSKAELPGRMNRAMDRTYVGTFTLKWGEGLGK